MNCRELVEFLMQYMEEELPPSERTSFEDHVQSCPPCLLYLETYRVTIRAGRAAYCGESNRLPGDVPEDLIRAILNARRELS